MKVKYKYGDKKESVKLTKEIYEVLGYGENNNEIYPIIILNDDLEFCNISEEAIEFIDKSKEEYIQINRLCYGANFYLKKELINYCKEFESYADLQNRHIWYRSKLVNYFIQSNYNLTSKLKRTVLNVDYKVTLIQGYILAVNNYISIRYQKGGWELFYFRQLDDLTKHIPERFRDDMKIEELNPLDYEKILYKHLERVIFIKSQGEKESKKIIGELFKLIDSIFINQIQSIHQVVTFYEDEIIIKYESKYYSLSKEWGS